MNAVFRVTWLYFTALPIQRWLFWSAISLSAFFAAMVVWRTAPGSAPGLGPRLFAALTLPMLLALFPGLFTGGALFRYLSAPPVHRLLPNFRPRMLAALGLWFLILFCPPAVVALVLASAQRTAPAIVPLATIFAFISGTFYFCFRVLAPKPWMLAEFVVFILLLQVASVLDGRLQLGDEVAVFSMLALTAAWVAFALWYLQGGNVNPVNLRGQGSLWSWSPKEKREIRLPERVPRDQAITTLLQGRITMPLTLESIFGMNLFRSIRTIALLVGVGFVGGAVVTHDDATLPVPIHLVIALGGAFGMGVAMSQMACRARSLWLLHGSGRLALLRILENQMLRLAPTGLILLISISAGLHLAGAGIGLPEAVRILALAAGFALVSVYIGLCQARNVGATEFFCWILAGTVAVVAYLGYVHRGWPNAVAIVAVVEIAVAGVLRWMTIHHWRKVDWLQFKLLKIGVTRQE